ncbi:hypothetical protein [Nocardia fluminea]|uniref:hypothetical protein n=1 Tax=Nocardia fluminea TaxID=134984 RepID=UPI003D1320C8
MDDGPEYASIGDKQYRTEHLVRLLQIKRLSDLGVPPAQIAAMGRADEDPDDAIRVLHAASTGCSGSVRSRRSSCDTGHWPTFPPASVTSRGTCPNPIGR